MPIDTSIKFVSINIAIITISDTRDFNHDSSGNILEKKISALGHNLIIRQIIKDDLKSLNIMVDPLYIGGFTYPLSLFGFLPIFESLVVIFIFDLLDIVG